MRLVLKSFTEVNNDELRILLGPEAFGDRQEFHRIYGNDLYAALNCGFDTTECLVIEDAGNGRLAGCACFSSRHCFIQGVSQEIIYLHKLRISPSYRGSQVLYHGLQEFNDRFIRKQPGRRYIMSIMNGNDRAQSVLTGGRCGFPSASPLCGFTTCCLPSHNADTIPAGYTLHHCRADERKEILKFFHCNGARHPYFPMVGDNELSADPAIIRYTMLLRSMGRIVGCAVLQDQGNCKNIWHSTATIPMVDHRAGSGIRSIPVVFAYGMVVLDDSIDHFSVLASGLTSEAFSLGYAYTIIGFPDTSPLLPTIRRISPVSFNAMLFEIGGDRREYPHNDLVHCFDASLL